MPNLNLTIQPNGYGQYAYSGDFNGLANLNGAGYYTLTGDISGLLTFNGYGQATLVGTSSNATYSGAVALSFTFNGYGQVSMSGTVGSSTISATLSLAGNGRATSSGTISSNALTYILQDIFTTAAAGPLSTPRTCEPGPGSLTILQTDGQFAVASNYLTWTAQATPVYGDLQTRDAVSVARATGRAFFFVLNFGGVAGNGPLAGFSTASPATANSVYGILNPTNNIYVRQGAVNVTGMFPNVSANTDYEFAVILRSTGMFILRKESGVWSLWWVTNTINTTPLYPVVAPYDTAGKTANWRLLDLSGLWTTDNGIANGVLASPNSGNTLTGSADGLAEFTWTPAAAETLELSFRYTDDSNRMIVRCDQAAGTVRLYEKNAGVETEKTGGTTTQTWTVATSYRIVVLYYGSTVKVFVADTSKNSNAACNFNTSVTGLKISGFTSGQNFISWPRTPVVDARI